jgi:hypothetical protein
MQTEASPTKQSSSVKRGALSSKDPVVLGVSLPLSVTVAAAAQVKVAWTEAFTAVFAAAKAKAAATKKAAKSEASEISA